MVDVEKRKSVVRATADSMQVMSTCANKKTNMHLQAHM
jgi:hypothetical protein